MKNWFKYVIAAIILLVIAFFTLNEKYIDLLWFQSMNADSVFWTQLLTGPLVKFLLFILVFPFLFLNMKIAFKAFNLSPDGSNLKERIIIPAFAVIILLSLSISGNAPGWEMIQQFINQVPSGVTDPTFGQDISFYLFSLPFLTTLCVVLKFLFLAVLIVSGAIYFMARAFTDERFSLKPKAKLHLTILTILFLSVKIWDYYLERFTLLLKDSDIITGINYVGEHANLVSLNILIALVALIIVVLIFSLFRQRSLLLFGSVALWLIVSVLLDTVYPQLIQTFVVTPNEYELEAPYIEQHIKMTRQAYGLDKIKLKSFVPQDNKNISLKADHPSLENLRLWNYEPLKSSYNQLQSLRSYYGFNDIDIDRYPTTDGNRQVMISAREMHSAQLSDQAKTWLNMHLVYTHGYGLAANQVNLFTAEGQPVFVSKNIPPQINKNYPAMQLKQPEIYFGESTDNYIITNTNAKEFDYPQGEQNISTVYRGSDGIALNSFLRKLMFSLKYSESNFLFSNYLTSNSRISFYRNIQERVRKLAPFLSYDEDPYLIAANGKIFWILDGHTVSSAYPYSRRIKNGINYIRNSVKAVVDAYDGTVSFYIIDDQDPLIKTWQKIFPQLFKSVDKAPAEIVEHFRYPEDLMLVQRQILNQYHMTDPQTFYQQEDYWTIPINEDKTLFEPYYVTLLLPEESEDEFVMLQPFCPRNKQNLSSWLIARCDAEHYGELILYTLPKDQNIYGPQQITTRINQNEVISQLITLWNQNQSEVIWGNLLIIPVEDSILYIKPMLLQSGTGKQAELKKIVVVYQNQVVIGDTISDALNNLVNTSIDIGDKTDSENKVETGDSKQPNLDKAQRIKAIIKEMEKHSQEFQRLLQELKQTEITQ